MANNFPISILPNDLELGDEVLTFPDLCGYQVSTVVKITDTMIEVVRPYIHISDTAYSVSIYNERGTGVIDYIGTERMVLLRSSVRPVTLLKRRRDPVK